MMRTGCVWVQFGREKVGNMKVTLLAVLLGCLPMFAQSAPPAAEPNRPRKEILRNDRVTAYLVEMAPGRVSPMHRHDKDVLTVVIDGAELKVKTPNGKSTTFRGTPGEVRFLPASFSHAPANIGKTTFRAVDVEFATPQGKKEPVPQKGTHYCNEGSQTACVTEKYLFCTQKFCVEDVTMGPGAKSTQHSHDTEHMLVAISDYSLSDDTTGKGVVQRDVKSGGVEYLPAGITHVLTNTGPAEARFIAIIFK
jgi:quercetin dioxygenase-like cupin family protein